MGQYDLFTRPGWKKIQLDLFGSITYYIRDDWEKYRLDEFNLEGFGFLPGGKPMASHTYYFEHGRYLYIRQRREWLDETNQNVVNFINRVVPDHQLNEFLQNNVTSESLTENNHQFHLFHEYRLPDEEGTILQFSNHICTTPEHLTIWEARYSYPVALENYRDPIWGGLTEAVGYNYFCNSVEYHPENVRF